jgi:SulP family sulfate permease
VIFCVIAAFGILEGIAFGFAVAIVLFVITYSRLSVIRSEVSGSAHASHVDRNPDNREILNREGHRIWIIRLQGFIFFGTADKVLKTIKARLSDHDRETRIRYLVLGFRHVSELDASAVQAFSKLAQLSDKGGVDIILTEISEQARSQLRAIAFFTDANATARRLEFAQLDDGVAWCEAQILAELGGETGRSGGTLEARLTRLLGDSTAAREIAPLFEPVTATAGDFLFHQGEPGDCLYLVHSGVAAVVMVFADGRERVVRIFQEGAIVGEMALYTGSPRSASVRIEESGTLFRLDGERLQMMQQQHPESAGLFHSFVVRLLADKLDRATKELQRYA